VSTFAPFFVAPKKGTKKKRGAAKKQGWQALSLGCFAEKGAGLVLGGIEREGSWGIMEGQR